MKRREFVGLIGGAAAWPLAVRAQQRERMRRIGVLTNHSESDRETQVWIGAFRQRLQELGWNEGRNIQFDYRWAAGDLNRLKSYATELVSLKMDATFGESTPVIAALQQATRTIPIVFVGGSNPVGSGFVASLSRPGGNITGFVSFEPATGGKWLETLREVVPGVAQAALIYNPQSHTGQYFQSIETAAQALAVKLVPTPFRDAAEIERAVNDFAREPNGGLLVLPDPSTGVHRDLIITLAARHRLPAVYPFRFFVVSGGLASYGIDRTDQYRKAAGYLDRILKGEKPGDLPVLAATKYELAINVKTAKALGLALPESLLARADEVIE
jgi:putative ABC transport system substrate-binding protein